MPIVAAKCTQCGADVQVDNSQEAAVCKYCGTPFIVETAINNFHITQNFAGANVTIMGQDFDSLKTRASMFLEEGDFDKALEYVEEALDMKPEDAELYCIKLLAKKRAKNLVQLQDLHVRLRGDIDFERAIKFGNKELVNELNAAANYVEKICKERDRITDLRKEKDRLSHERSVLEFKWENNSHKYGGAKFLKVICYIFAPILILGGLVCCIVVPPFGILCIAFGISLPFISKKYTQKGKEETGKIMAELDAIDRELKAINEIIDNEK